MISPDNLSAIDDDELYNRYLNGEGACGDELMIRYGDSLIAYINAFVKNFDDAEDMMLDCFTVILVDKPMIRRGAFKAYLFRIARNKACHLWTKKKKQNEFLLTEDVLSDELSPEEKIMTGHMEGTLAKCLNRIAPQYREALWLIYGMDLSYDQASRIMNCGKKRIDNLISNGKKSLRAELEKEGITNGYV